MKAFKTAPRSGQFIAVWVYGGKIWSETYRVVAGDIECYDAYCDEWRLTGAPEECWEGLNAVFYKASRAVKTPLNRSDS